MNPKPLGGNRKRRPVSCAECRRLKLRCNRVWPCTSCEKRGLAELCPQGFLTTRSRFRPIIPEQQDVLQRMHELQSRINELEAALAALQATVSTQPHPVLADLKLPYLQRKLMRKAAFATAQEQAVAAGTADMTTELHPSDPGEIIDAMGTLSIAPDGKSRFFGPTAVSERLATVQETERSGGATQAAQMHLPVDIVALAQSFPFTTLTGAVAEVHERIRSYLPPVERAETLCECYFTIASFVAYPVPQDKWFEDLFYRLYGTRRSSAPSSNFTTQDSTARQHQLYHVPPDEFSLFLSVLALGALTDVSIEAFSAEAEVYYQLSRALLTRENVLTEPTLASVQALFLGSYYEGMQSQGTSSRDCWIMMVLASKTAHIIGLHRDQSMFGLHDVEVQRRRLIFWEVHSMDLIESLAFGRPSSLAWDQTDTKMPVDIHTTADSASDDESFYSWKFRFCSEVLSVVGDHVLRVAPPSYASALAADRKLREFNTTYGRSASHGNTKDLMTATQLQMMIGTRETSMLYIHRIFFAHALSTEPTHPEKSKYGRSVVAAFESARLIVNGMQSFVRSHTKLAARVWFFWNHLLSASFVLGSIVSHAPGSSFAPPSSALLGLASEILQQASIYGGRAAYMLPIIMKLSTKGFHARLKYERRSTAPTQNVYISTEEDDNDELVIIGGKTRLVISKPTPLQLFPGHTPFPSATAPPSTSARVLHGAVYSSAVPDPYAPRPEEFASCTPDLSNACGVWPQGVGKYVPGETAHAPELDAHTDMAQYSVFIPGDANHIVPALAYNEPLRKQVQGHESPGALDVIDNAWLKLMSDLGA